MVVAVRGAEILRRVSEAGAVGLTHGGGEQRKEGIEEDCRALAEEGGRK